MNKSYYDIIGVRFKLGRQVDDNYIGANDHFTFYDLSNFIYDNTYKKVRANIGIYESATVQRYLSRLNRKH